MKKTPKTEQIPATKPPLPKPGETVEWPISAQGSKRTGRGAVIAVAAEGGVPPKDIWPKDREKPSGRQLMGFAQPRAMPYAIVEETIGGKAMYRTPPLHTPLTIVTEPAKKKR